MPALLKTTQIQEPSSATVNMTLDTSGNVSFDGMPYGASSFLRNRIINGNMAIDQRNAGATQTFTAAAALAYSVDRWYGYCTGANVTGARVTGATANQYRYRFTGAASVTAIGFGQRIEAINSADLAGTTATLSVVLSNSLLTTVTWTAYYANTADTFGSLASPTVTSIATGTFTVNSTATTYSANITIPSAATTGIQILFTVGAQTSGTWVIGNVQLEPGSVATPFERPLISKQVADCQRYYETNFPSGTAPGAIDSTNPTYLFMDGLATQTHTGQQYVQYKIVKRASATVTIYSISNGASGVLYDYNGTTNRTAATQFAGPWSFIGYSTSLGSANNINMAFNWTAAAEL
jgi:hypothetical protein